MPGGVEVSDIVAGGLNLIAFREIPPPSDIFVHELVHPSLDRSGLKDPKLNETLTRILTSIILRHAEKIAIREALTDNRKYRGKYEGGFSTA